MIQEYIDNQFHFKVFHDPDCNAREQCDNLGKIICFHGRYDMPKEIDGINTDDFNSWEEMKNHLEKEYAVVLPIYMYDHSGTTVNTMGFSCPWDSGQIGFIVASAADIRENFGSKRCTPKIKESAEKTLKNEVETWDQEMTGQTYWVELENLQTNETDQCGRYYGTEFTNNGVLDFLMGSMSKKYALTIIANLQDI
jgi:hypothetical protein